MSNQTPKSSLALVKQLSRSIQQGLETGERYVELLNVLANDQDPAVLLDATKDLTKLDLTSDFVKLPEHYNFADYYLIFVDRLLGLLKAQNTRLQGDHNDLRMQIAELGEDVAFKFERRVETNEVCFADQEYHLALFSLDLDQRVLGFNSQTLVDFFVVNHRDQAAKDLQTAVAPLIKLAKFVQSELNFTIDLGILDTDNQFAYHLNQPNLHTTVIDKLFVATADTGYFLMNLPESNGAELELEDQVKLQIIFDPQAEEPQWFFMVQDQAGRVSFFDLLLNSNLIQTWYLDNRADLAIRPSNLGGLK